MTEITSYINTLCGIAAAVTAARRAPSEAQIAQRTRAAAAMLEAKTIYRETVRQDPHRRSRLYWYDCLRAGWQAVRDRETLRRLESVEDFLRLPPETQDTILRRLAASAPRRAAVRIKVQPDGTRTPAPSTACLWMVPAARGGMELVPWEEAISAVAHQAWVDIADGRARADLPAAVAISRVVDYAAVRIGRIVRGGRARAAADVPEALDPAAHLAASFPGPEEETVRLAAVETVAPGALDAVRTLAAAHDPDAALRRLASAAIAGAVARDAVIIAATAAGYGQQDIAALLQITQSTVSRSLDRIRAAAAAIA